MVVPVGRSGQGANWLKGTAGVGCGVTKLVRAVITVLIACCLLRLQEAQLHKSVFLSVVEVCIDLAWKNPPPLSSCNGDKDWPFSLLPKPCSAFLLQMTILQ